MREGYEVLVTEVEVLEKVKSTKNCVYCGTSLRYIKLKGLSKNLYAELDRRNGETVLSNDTIQIINATGLRVIKPMPIFEYCKRINHIGDEKDLTLRMEDNYSANWNS
jgi:hypothetical protein